MIFESGGLIAISKVDIAASLRFVPHEIGLEIAIVPAMLVPGSILRIRDKYPQAGFGSYPRHVLRKLVLRLQHFLKTRFRQTLAIHPADDKIRIADGIGVQ